MRRVFEALHRLQRRENAPPSLSAVRIAAEGQHGRGARCPQRFGRHSPVNAGCQLPGAREAARPDCPPGHASRRPEQVGRGRRMRHGGGDQHPQQRRLVQLGPRLGRGGSQSCAGGLPSLHRPRPCQCRCTREPGAPLPDRRRLEARQAALPPRRSNPHRRTNLPATTWAPCLTNSKKATLALDYYRRAVSIPDAHYNLARIFGLRGDELSSLRHLKRYRQLGGT